MPVSSHALTDALAGIVGKDRLLTDSASLASCAVDGALPAWIVRPESVDDVSRLLRLAAEERLAVAPRGSGTLMGLGNPPRRLDGVLDLSGLAAVVDYEPADLTATVQCGIPLAALAPRLAAQRQFFPLDPLDGSSRSVGGVLATNASGPLRYRYGTPRDLLLGVRFVQADGTVTWGGARVVKSVTGYDVPKLMVGSLGTLGVLVEATLRLHPVPESEGTWVVTFPAAERAAGLLAAILDSSLQPNRLAILSGTAAARTAGAAALAVSFGSVPEAVTAQGEDLVQIARGEGGRAVAAEGDFWSRPWGFLAGAAVVLKVAAPPSEAAALCGKIQQLATGIGISAGILGEAGNGVLHVALTGTLSAAEWESRVIGALRARVAPAGGSVVVERAPREVKERLDVWGPVEPETLALMNRLKSEFDPLGTLNPGRYVDRI
ncbi:MAG: FAD-binding oxidoreductase [candidate division NC10 bacterium]